MEDIILSEKEEEQDILFGVINRFIGYFTRQAMPETSNDTTREYPFVAMDTRQAYEQILLVRNFLATSTKKKAPLKFIDIGCGIGNILLLAEMMGFDVFGIEKDTASLKIAKSLVDDQSVNQEDIWNFDRLKNFDVVYYFRPFCQKNLQLKFEKHIEDSLNTGTILIANRKMSQEINSDNRFLQLDPKWPIWQKCSQ